VDTDEPLRTAIGMAGRNLRATLVDVAALAQVAEDDWLACGGVD
jgi:hypothetical protein